MFKKQILMYYLSGITKFDTLKGSIVLGLCKKIIKDKLFLAARTKVYNPDGGLYQIVENKMSNVSNKFGVDSEKFIFKCSF